MTDIKKFTNFLKDNDFKDSWDTTLTITETSVNYRDQGGVFQLDENANGTLTFTCTDIEKNVLTMTFKNYDEFLDTFEELYCLNED